MHRTMTRIAALATFTAMTATASSATLAYSSFDTGDEGWIAQQGPAGAPYAVHWNPSGGVPTGNINYWDQTSYNPEWFSASASFIGSGDFSQAVNNGGVSFDWATDLGSAAQMVQVAFTGGYQGGSILWAETVASVGTGWANYDFSFDSTTLWMLEANSTTTIATMADMTGVLSATDGLFITADTVDGMDGSCWLDNPMIHSVPAPGALALLGLASIVGARRRRN
jgi:MYXO-CTERM domain-containing protein